MFADSPKTQQAMQTIKNLMESAWPAPYRLEYHNGNNGWGVNVYVRREHYAKCYGLLYIANMEEQAFKTYVMIDDNLV